MDDRHWRQRRLVALICGMRSLHIVCLLIFLAAECTAQEKVQTLFYKVNIPGARKASYLFGTIHLADPRITAWDKAVLRAYRKSDVVAGEINAVNMREQLEAMRYVSMKDSTIYQLLSTEDSILLQSALREKGSTELMLLHERLKPMLLAAMLLEDTGPDQLDFVPDVALQRMAVRDGKRVTGLESVSAHYGAFDSMTYREQAQMLMETVRGLSEWPQIRESTIQSYLRGDIQGILDMGEMAEMNVSLEHDLLIKRNILMADQFMALAVNESVFCAVGAAHLGGTEGMVVLLQSKGCMVTPVPFRFLPPQ
jgi:uncharacterized protein